MFKYLYCPGKINIIFEHYVIHNFVHKDDCGFEEYLVNLKKQVKLCDNGAMADDFVCDTVGLSVVCKMIA